MRRMSAPLDIFRPMLFPLLPPAPFRPSFRNSLSFPIVKLPTSGLRNHIYLFSWKKKAKKTTEKRPAVRVPLESATFVLFSMTFAR